VFAGVALASACKPKASAGIAGAPSASSSGALAASAAPANVDHGELDTQAPGDSPKIAATNIASTVYKLPDVGSRRLGYIRLGGAVDRDAEPTRGKGCKGQWYHIFPMGYVCTDEATIDLETPLVRAASRRPDSDQPMPYRYGFVRATAPQYLRIPTHQEQLKSEFKLDEQLAWFEQNRKEVQQVVTGANDVPLDGRGIATPGLSPKPGFRASPTLSEIELFGEKAQLARSRSGSTGGARSRTCPAIPCPSTPILPTACGVRRGSRSWTPSTPRTKASTASSR
jgi:hypothetical protein